MGIQFHNHCLHGKKNQEPFRENKVIANIAKSLILGIISSKSRWPSRDFVLCPNFLSILLTFKSLVFLPSEDK